MAKKESNGDWKAKASAAYQKYLEALERDLAAEADIGDIEAAMLRGEFPRFGWTQDCLS